MNIPGASRYRLCYDEAYCLYIRVYSLTRDKRMTPNSQGAVTLVCDDGVRRCKTVRQWALLCERSEGEEK